MSAVQVLSSGLEPMVPTIEGSEQNYRTICHLYTYEHATKKDEIEAFLKLQFFKTFVSSMQIH
jgi:hypothetical protein